jgi:hypothetical protein
LTIPAFGLSIPIIRKGVLMRNLLISVVVLLMIASTITAGDIRLEGNNFATVAYIRDSGRIENASFEILGYIKEDGRIEDDSFHTLGYIDEDGQIEDDSFQNLFTLNENGRLTDTGFIKVAEIQSDGTVEDNHFQVILYADGTHEKMTERIAIFLVFFSDLLED